MIAETETFAGSPNNRRPLSPLPGGEGQGEGQTGTDHIALDLENDPRHRLAFLHAAVLMHQSPSDLRISIAYLLATNTTRDIDHASYNARLAALNS